MVCGHVHDTGAFVRDFRVLWLILGGGGLHLGVVESSATLILLLMLTLFEFRLSSLLCLEVTCRQVQNSSHTLFLVAPGPAGVALVDEVTWPVPILRHKLLSWPLSNPHPWVEQKPSVSH